MKGDCTKCEFAGREIEGEWKDHPCAECSYKALDALPLDEECEHAAPSMARVGGDSWEMVAAATAAVREMLGAIARGGGDSPLRTAIIVARLAGASYGDIATQFDISRRAVERHCRVASERDARLAQCIAASKSDSMRGIGGLGEAHAEYAAFHLREETSHLRQGRQALMLALRGEGWDGENLRHGNNGRKA
jgi:hypothetical protein